MCDKKRTRLFLTARVLYYALFGALFLCPKGAAVNKNKAIDNIHRKYPFVNENLGYIPKWVYLVIGHPKITAAAVSVTGFAAAALLMHLILQTL